MTKVTKIKLADVWYYLQGNYRYKLYYSKHFKWLIRRHIREQIEYRIKWMNRLCYERGSCIICGCQTTALQMCNKSCDQPCYPPMMDSDDWRKYKNYRTIHFKHGAWYMGFMNGQPYKVQAGEYIN